VSDQIAAVEAELAPMRDALLADGYRLDVHHATDQLSLEVVALENACADCLVPEAVMATLVSAKLGGTYAADDISIKYPAK